MPKKSPVTSSSRCHNDDWCLKNSLLPFFCIGQTLVARALDSLIDIGVDQLLASLEKHCAELLLAWHLLYSDMPSTNDLKLWLLSSGLKRSSQAAVLQIDRVGDFRPSAPSNPPPRDGRC